MATKLDLKMDEIILAAHLGLSERKCQSIFDKKKLFANGIVILKWPLKKQSDRIHVAKDGGQRLTLINTVTKFMVPYKAGNILTN